MLALSFSVTYWDYLGWKDTYGKPEFTQRQVDYEPALGQPGPYTPQMVFNGSTTVVGNDLSEVESFIAAARPSKGPALAFGGDRVEIGGASKNAGSADVWLVRYDPNVEAVPVARGENGGTTLQHTHVVHRLERLGSWDGTKTSFLPTGAADGVEDSSPRSTEERRGNPVGDHRLIARFDRRLSSSLDDSSGQIGSHATMSTDGARGSLVRLGLYGS